VKKWPVEGLGDILSISRERIEPLAYPKKYSIISVWKVLLAIQAHFMNISHLLAHQ